jgi:hypothetical protein
MALKINISAVLVLCLLVLTSCTFPFFSTSPTVQIPPPATQSSISGSVETLTVTLPIETVTVTNTSQAAPTNTSQPIPTNKPALQWNLIGVGCLSTTNIEITLSVGVPATGVTGVCAGALPCSTSSLVKYACQLVPRKDGQVYCQGLHADTGSALTACLQLPSSSQPVCNTFDNFQHYLAPCTCVSLYTTAASCNADTNCVWNPVPLTCGKKP